MTRLTGIKRIQKRPKRTFCICWVAKSFRKQNKQINLRQIYTVLFCFITCLVKAQSISPSPNNEYCPETEITFTVTIPGTYQSILGTATCYVTVPPYNFSSSGGFTTFNFKGI